MAYTKDIGMMDIYKSYVEASKSDNKKYVSYKIFAKILKDVNLAIRYKIVYESERFKIPFRMGELSIRKFETNYTKENKSTWRVNYIATKKAGHVVYYGSLYGYRWRWNKLGTGCSLNGKKWYNFKPCRSASRAIADAVINKQVDYYQ